MVKKVHYFIERRRAEILSAMGLGLIAGGVALYTLPLGVIVAGVACLVFEWRISK